jgi:hypothetical protein
MPGVFEGLDLRYRITRQLLLRGPEGVILRDSKANECKASPVLRGIRIATMTFSRLDIHLQGFRDYYSSPSSAFT